MITIRIRSITWFVTGAVLTVAVTLIFVTAWRADAAPVSGESTFVPITSCRLVDTRPAPDRVGPFSSWGAMDTKTVQATGTNGNCTIPTDADALSMKVFALNATADSFVTIWKGGALPLGSALNPSPGGIVFSAVTTDLSAGGSFDGYNQNGSVDLIIDVNGYFTTKTLLDFESRLSANATAIATNTGNIATNTGNIAANATAIGTNSSDISTLDTRVDGIETNVLDRTVYVSGDGSDAVNGSRIDAAITATAAATVADPWVIKLDAGVFDLGSSGIVLPDFVSLIGSGERATRIEGTDHELIDSGTSSVIADLWVDQTDVGIVDEVAVHIDDDDVVLRDVYVTAAGDDGIEVEQASGVLIDGVEIDAADFAVDVGANTIGLVVRDSILRSTTQQALDGGTNPSDTTIEHSYLETTAPTGVNLPDQVINIPSGKVTVYHSILVSQNGGSVQSLASGLAQLFMHSTHVDVVDPFGVSFTTGTATCTALSTPTGVSTTTCV